MLESLRGSPEFQLYNRIASLIRAKFPEPQYKESRQLDESLVRSLLQTKPQRVKHMIAELNLARNIAPHLKRDKKFIRDFEQAALFHDIGYSEKLQMTGYHPLDGAIFLAHHGASDRVVCAVLFHSAASELSKTLDQNSPARIFYEQIGENGLTFFDRALEVVDLHTSPIGKRVSLKHRIEEIYARPVYKGTKLAEIMVKLYPHFRKSLDLILLTGGLPVRNLLPVQAEQALDIERQYLQDDVPARKFNPDLFDGTAWYYARYRQPYPEELFKAIKERFGLDGTGSLLDIGAGTGRLSIPLAQDFKEIVAAEPLPAMIREGKKQAEISHATNITWVTGTAANIVPSQNNLRKFQLVTMGNVAHWLDLAKTLQDINPFVENNGGIAIVDGGSIWEGNEEWRQIMRDTYKEFLGERAAGKGNTYIPPQKPFIQTLAESPFNQIEQHAWEVDEYWTAESILGNLQSTSYASGPVLEEKLGVRKELFKQALKRRLLTLNPENTFTGKAKYTALFATRTE